MSNETWELSSPDGSVHATVIFDKHERSLLYAVSHDQVVVIAPSLLGIVRSDADFSHGLDSISVTPTETIEDSYLVAHGKQTAVREFANEFSVLASVDGHDLDIVFRAYNDGVAFRYICPGDGEPVSLVDEVTEFAFAQGGAAWLQATQEPALGAPAYENLYEDGIAIGTATDAPSWNLGGLFLTGQRWVMLTESDLDSGYVGSHLGAAPAGRTYQVVLPHESDGLGVGEVEPSSVLPWTLPWRIVLVSSTPGSIVQSNLVQNLARPSATPTPAWVQPGRVSWGWWGDHHNPRNVQALRTYVDLAAEMGWEHTLVDANWHTHSEAEIKELVEYAEGENVGVFLWYNSGGPSNEVTEGPRDRMYEREQRRTEMAKLASWGVRGIKVDFFHSDKQAAMAQYLGILEDAVDFGLMINFHGCTIPRGWSRTYPHLMTMESVAGAEQYGFMEAFPEAAPRHNVTLAFTRNVIGPMDYTPVTFSDSAFPHVTTNAHELALSVVFQSGLQHFADTAESYRSQTQPVVEFLRQVPVVWDETRFVAGMPGEYIVMARRNGSTWYVGGINGSSEPQPVSLAFDFARGQEVTILSDGEGRDDIVAIDLDLEGPLSLTMAPFGGFSMRVPG